MTSNNDDREYWTWDKAKWCIEPLVDKTSYQPRVQYDASDLILLSNMNKIFVRYPLWFMKNGRELVIHRRIELTRTITSLLGSDIK